VARKEAAIKRLSIRELRASLPELEKLLAREGEVVVTRHGRAIARLVAVEHQVEVPSLAELRARMGPVAVPSEVLLREERDER
jgi:antitoxin (DNA-binding transcriptional repressor) of toxin-antitoxin stability system